MITPAYSPTATERVLPRLALDFTTGTLDARVTVTRALNTATAVNSSGYVAVVNANLPRFDYDPTTLAPKGLLIEESRSNVMLQSANFNTASWIKSGLSPLYLSGISPDGTQNADFLREDATNGFHFTYQQVTLSATAYSWSMYIKPSGRDWIYLYADGGVTTAYINVTTGAIGTTTGTPTITRVNAGNGWYRITMSYTGTNTSAQNMQIRLASANGTTSYQGDGASGAYVWGVQLEAGSFATSYIPTTTTSVTRNADVVSMTGTNFSSWFNASEGAFSATAQIAQLTGTFPIFVSANDGTLNNYLNCYPYNPSSPNMVCISQVGGVQQYLGVPGAVSVNIKTNVCFAYKASSFASAMNGTGLQSASTGSIPTVDRLTLGSTTSNYFLNGHLQKVNYWSQRITNAEVQAFSKVG